MISLQEVALAEVGDECRLGSDVIDAKGRCLLTAGNILGAGARSLLQSRGIVSVVIQVEQSCDPEQLAEQRARLTDEVDRRFRNSGDDAGLAKLRDLILAYRLRYLR